MISGLLALGIIVSSSFGQNPQQQIPQKSPYPIQMNPLQQTGPYVIYFVPKAPDMTGQGFYYTNSYGITYGPNYCVTPPFPPFNGLIPIPCFGQMNNKPSAYPGMSFPSHPFNRSPRDFFMID